jgi:hypothetical protein
MERVRGVDHLMRDLHTVSNLDLIFEANAQRRLLALGQREATPDVFIMRAK